MNQSARWLGAFVFVLCLGGASSSHAQRLGGQRFAPAASEDGVLSTEGADARRPLFPYVSLFTHYALRPVTVVDGNGDELGAPVEHLVGADLVGSIPVFRGLEIGLGVPVTFYSAGDDADAQAAGLPEAPGVAMGDMTLRVGYRLRLSDHTGLALHLPVLLPTTQDDNVLGLGFGLKPTVALFQRVGQIELLFNLSYLYRDDEEALDFEGGQELGARVAARVALDSRFRTGILLEAGVTTSVADFFSAATTPAEASVGLEHWWGRHVRLTAFLGTGLSTGVGAPDLRAGVGLSYGDNPPYRPRPAPRAGDRDGDGILDEKDQCPDDAEDPDGFEDEDGCPDPDNDSDGILDEEDRCPSAPETANGISDEDGCPDLIALDDTLITTFEAVHFRTNSDVILERSHPMLREVASVLKVNPEMRIRVEGHTDAQGDDQHNLELSQRRAESVRRFLVEQGAAEGRIDAQGLGETRPIADNNTRGGRAKNRRVEFHIVPK